MDDPQVLESLQRARRWLLISFPVAWIALVVLWQMSLVVATGVAFALWLPVGGVFFFAVTKALEEEQDGAEASTFESQARVGLAGRLAAFSIPDHPQLILPVGLFTADCGHKRRFLHNLLELQLIDGIGYRIFLDQLHNIFPRSRF